MMNFITADVRYHAKFRGDRAKPLPSYGDFTAFKLPSTIFDFSTPVLCTFINSGFDLHNKN